MAAAAKTAAAMQEVFRCSSPDQNIAGLLQASSWEAGD